MRPAPAPEPSRSADRVRLPTLVAVAVLSYAVLYAPQPLLPLFATRFSVSESAAALLITAALLPLSVAPLLYGYLLEAAAPARVLRTSVLLLGILQVGVALAGGFALLLSLRFLQGLVLPAVLTALMTHLATSAPPGQLQRAMSAYIAATIVGGYAGRLVAGSGAAFVSWRLVLGGLGVGLLILVLPMRGPRAAERAGAPELRAELVLRVLRSRSNAAMYAIAFCVFFVFAALLNYVPFRLTELLRGPTELWAGLIYTGFLMGVATALGSRRLVERMGGEANALSLGLVAYLCSLLVTLVPDRWILFGALFGFCGSMFFVHTVAAGLVNRRAAHTHGIVNGLYLVSYYSGGTLGSYLPGLVYERGGWSAFVLVLVGVAAAGLGVAVAFRAFGPRVPAAT